MQLAPTEHCDAGNRRDFALAHEDALAACVAVNAVVQQLAEERRGMLAGVLLPLLNTLQEYLIDTT